MATPVGIVAIGRNEGARLIACLRSAPPETTAFVYVDSGSTDNSVQAARELGVEVVALDLSVGFTAARARNAGYARLKQLCGDLAFVQFVDGDCVIDPLWLGHALETMERRPDVAAVCGRRRERAPEQTIYNALCDIEWNTPVGESTAFGGDVLVRCTAFDTAGRYNERLIAGEEPELAVRMRERGAKIIRLDKDMTYHDAAMTTFDQWWKRAVRAGHAYGEVAWMHRRSPKGIWRKEVVRALLWGGLIPLATLGLAVCWSPWCLLLAVVYPLQIVRIALRSQDTGRPWTYAFFMTVAKFAQVVGIAKFFFNRIRGRSSTLIEYKGPTASDPRAAAPPG
jgi:GT2 family glycosyltransferase